MKKVLKTILMGAVAFSLAMGVGCVTGENSSLEKESSKAEDSSSQNKRRQLRDKSDYGKVIALTFDDGPNTDTTPLVLDKLEEHGIVASFFVIGNNITDESAEVMKRAYNMGCDIENHSQSHPDMTKMTAKEIKAEIDFTSDKVEEAVGERPQFFRPPYIAVNQTMFDVIDMPFICGYGAEDYNNAIGVEERVEKVLAQARDGGIILLHDMNGNVQTVAALDKIIPALKEQGYEFVTITELFHADCLLHTACGHSRHVPRLGAYRLCGRQCAGTQHGCRRVLRAPAQQVRYPQCQAVRRGVGQPVRAHCAAALPESKNTNYRV